MDRHTSYVKQYAKYDSYLTPADLKILPLPASLIFYSNLLRIVIYSNREARNKVYNDFRWANSSIDVVESLERSGVKLNFYGMHNILKTGKPAVFVGNQMLTNFRTYGIERANEPVAALSLRKRGQLDSSSVAVNSS